MLRTLLAALFVLTLISPTNAREAPAREPISTFILSKEGEAVEAIFTNAGALEVIGDRINFKFSPSGTCMTRFLSGTNIQITGSITSIVADNASPAPEEATLYSGKELIVEGENLALTESGVVVPLLDDERLQAISDALDRRGGEAKPVAPAC